MSLHEIVHYQSASRLINICQSAGKAYEYAVNSSDTVWDIDFYMSESVVVSSVLEGA